MNNKLRLFIVSATMDDDDPIYRKYFRFINDNLKYPIRDNYNELTKGLLILVLICTVFGFICQIYGTVCGKILVWTPIIMFIVSWIVFGKKI